MLLGISPLYSYGIDGSRPDLRICFDLVLVVIHFSKPMRMHGYADPDIIGVYLIIHLLASLSVQKDRSGLDKDAVQKSIIPDIFRFVDVIASQLYEAHLPVFLNEISRCLPCGQAALQKSERKGL